ncbi:hypothetical protein Pgin02_00790 [Porphyromonas gingivalis]|nr:hypothetical protein HMPREF1553_01769 [Porphyromonas gingivalis F0568]
MAYSQVMNNHDLSVQKAVLSDFRKSCRFPDLLLLFAKIPCNSPILCVYAFALFTPDALCNLLE